MLLTANEHVERARKLLRLANQENHPDRKKLLLSAAKDHNALARLANFLERKKSRTRT
jgi:hypothetical protein